MVSIVDDDKSDKVAYQANDISQSREFLPNIKLDDLYLLLDPNLMVELYENELQNLKQPSREEEEEEKEEDEDEDEKEEDKDDDVNNNCNDNE